MVAEPLWLGLLSTAEVADQIAEEATATERRINDAGTEIWETSFEKDQEKMNGGSCGVETRQRTKESDMVADVDEKTGLEVLEDHSVHEVNLVQCGDELQTDRVNSGRDQGAVGAVHSGRP